MEIKEMAKRIEKAGGRLYLVGGAIRDQLLGVKNEDEDYCVTGLTIQEFQTLFPQCFLKGKAFEVLELEGKEFAMARTERKQGIGHKEFAIQTGKTITIEQDLARRDVTINSIGQDVLTGNLIDPFGGQEDSKNKVIRATTEKFKEDPLRVYRIARLAAKFPEFTIEENTIKMMKELKEELKTLSKERVFEEFKKALATECPALFFDTLLICDVLEVHFKPIANLVGAEQPKQYHPEGDAYQHTMQALTSSVKETNQLFIRFSVLVHDLGKGTTPKEEYPHHYRHEITGLPIIEEFSKRLGVPNSWRKCGQTACREHMRGGIFAQMKPAKKVEFIERVAKTYLGLTGLQIVVNCDKERGTGEERQENFRKSQFAEVGKQCLEQVTAKKVAQKFGLPEGEELGKKLHEQRVEWMKRHKEESS